MEGLLCIKDPQKYVLNVFSKGYQSHKHGFFKKKLFCLENNLQKVSCERRTPAGLLSIGAIQKAK